MLELNINGDTVEIGDDVDPQTPLLWVLRDALGMVGTKYGCGIGQCSACTVHVNGAPLQSCQLPVQNAVGQRITPLSGIVDNAVLQIAAGTIRRGKAKGA